MWKAAFSREYIFFLIFVLKLQEVKLNIATGEPCKQESICMVLA